MLPPLGSSRSGEFVSVFLEKMVSQEGISRADLSGAALPRTEHSAVEEVLPKLTGAHGFFQRDVRGSDQSHIRLRTTVDPTALNSFSCSNRSNFTCMATGNESIRPAENCPQKPRRSDPLSCECGRIRTAFMAEELILEQFGGTAHSQELQRACLRGGSNNGWPAHTIPCRFPFSPEIRTVASHSEIEKPCEAAPRKWLCPTSCLAPTTCLRRATNSSSVHDVGAIQDAGIKSPG